MHTTWIAVRHARAKIEVPVHRFFRCGGADLAITNELTTIYLTPQTRFNVTECTSGMKVNTFAMPSISEAEQWMRTMVRNKGRQVLHTSIDKAFEITKDFRRAIRYDASSDSERLRRHCYTFSYGAELDQSVHMLEQSVHMLHIEKSEEFLSQTLRKYYLSNHLYIIDAHVLDVWTDDCTGKQHGITQVTFSYSYRMNSPYVKFIKE